MSNHPNRSKKPDNQARNPTPDEVRQARETVQDRLEIGITEAQQLCAENVFCNLRSWQKWETDADTSDSSRRMHPAFWKLHNLTKDDIKRKVKK